MNQHNRISRPWLCRHVTMLLVVVALASVIGITEAFITPQHCQSNPHRSTLPLIVSKKQNAVTKKNSAATTTTSSTRLNLLLDVPEGFFTVTMLGAGVLLSWSRSFARIRMEERAWELRLDESRKAKIASDPTLTEIELRRKEAAMEWSAYGKPRMEEERLEKERQQRIKELENEIGESTFGDPSSRGGGNRRVRTKVMDYDDDDEENDNYVDEVASKHSYRMTDDEIKLFELEHGIDYDPYYDDPYTEDELPDDIKYQTDKKYGDRIYENGEIFYKDRTSGMFYRQGAKPRNLSFW